MNVVKCFLNYVSLGGNEKGGESEEENVTQDYIVSGLHPLIQYELNINECYIHGCLQVITVLIKSTQREESVCQSSNALLATVCLFCGDEVSRQQFRR